MRNHSRANAPALAALTAFLGLTALLVLAAPEKAAARPEEGYVGIEACAACHEETVAAFRLSIHGQQGFAMRSSHSCETCHGPGKAHVDAGGGKGTMITIAGLSKDKRSEMCLSCHGGSPRTDWTGSIHESRGLTCEDCHSIHHPLETGTLLKERETDQCFGCHKRQKSEFYRSSHHPVREGLMTCSSCHDPHDVQEGRILVQPTEAETCYRCHAEKRGPFLWEHVPVREDCVTCHSPHGSSHLKMLNAKEPFLCQRCHSETRHPGTLYDQSQLNVASNRLFGRSCTNCHATIHGSNHPSGKTFVR